MEIPLFQRLKARMTRDVTWADLRRRHKARPMSFNLENDRYVYLGETHSYPKKWISAERKSGKWEYTYLDDDDMISVFKEKGIQDEDLLAKGKRLSTNRELDKYLMQEFTNGYPEPRRLNVERLLEAKVMDRPEVQKLQAVERDQMRKQARIMVEREYDGAAGSTINAKHRSLNTVQNWEDIGRAARSEIYPLTTQKAKARKKELEKKAAGEGLSPKQDAELDRINRLGSTERERELQAQEDARRLQAVAKQEEKQREAYKAAQKKEEVEDVTELLGDNSNATISSLPGMRFHPILKRRKMHRGLDIAAPKGTQVLSALDGKVIHAGPMGTYGNLVIVEHENNRQTRYAHLDSVSVAKGDTVKRGAFVGKVGKTGRSTGNHLHFELLEIKGKGKPRVLNPDEVFYLKNIPRKKSLPKATKKWLRQAKQEKPKPVRTSGEIMAATYKEGGYTFKILQNGNIERTKPGEKTLVYKKGAKNHVKLLGAIEDKEFVNAAKAAALPKKADTKKVAPPKEEGKKEDTIKWKKDDSEEEDYKVGLSQLLFPKSHARRKQRRKEQVAATLKEFDVKAATPEQEKQFAASKKKGEIYESGKAPPPAADVSFDEVIGTAGSSPFRQGLIKKSPQMIRSAAKTEAGKLGLIFAGLTVGDVVGDWVVHSYGPAAKYAKKRVAELEAKAEAEGLGRDPALEAEEYREMTAPVRAMAEQSQRQTEAAMAGMGESRRPADLARVREQKQMAINQAIGQAAEAQSSRRAARAAQEKAELQSLYAYQQQTRENRWNKFMGGLGLTAGKMGEVYAAQAKSKPMDINEIAKGLKTNMEYYSAANLKKYPEREVQLYDLSHKVQKNQFNTQLMQSVLQKDPGFKSVNMKNIYNGYNPEKQ